jgi:hypothetical protein
VRTTCVTISTTTGSNAGTVFRPFSGIITRQILARHTYIDLRKGRAGPEKAKDEASEDGPVSAEASGGGIVFTEASEGGPMSAESSEGGPLST